MASNYPTSLDSFTDPLSNSPLNSPSHAGQHQDLNNSVEQLEAKLGTGASPAASATANKVLVANGSGGSSWAAVPEYALQTGLVLISSTSVGSGVTSVPISNVFSSSYDSYHVAWNGGVASTLGDMRLILGSTTTGYAYNLIYTIYGSTTVQAVTSANDSSWKYIGGLATDSIAVAFDIHNPNKAYKTFVSGSYIGVTTTNGAGQFIGLLNNSTQYTGFTLYVDSPTTLTGGTISVFGYRK